MLVPTYHLRIVTRECEKSVQVNVEVLRRHLVLVSGSVGPHVAHLTTELNQNLEIKYN